MVPEPLAFYQQQVDRLQEAYAGVDVKCRWSGLARGLTFLAAAATFFAAFFQYRDQSALWWPICGALTAVFLVLVIYHGYYDQQRQRFALQRAFFRQGLARIRRDWNNITNPLAWSASDRSVVATPESAGTTPAGTVMDRVTMTDLDLEGEKSLWRLLNLARTPGGQACLRQWMVTADTLAASQQRQESVQGLAEVDAWRHEFLLSCWGSVSPVSNPATIVAWATGPTLPSWLPAMVWVARLSTAACVLLLITGLLGWISPQWLGSGLFVLVLGNFLISVFTSGWIHERFRQVASRAEDVRQYDRLLEMLSSLPLRTPLLDRLRQRVHRGLVDSQTERGSAHRPAMRSLLVWSILGNLRSGVTFIAYVILQFLFLWDLHILAGLESWRARWGQALSGWFESLGELEALAVLAQCRFDHPQWVFPELVPTEAGRALIVGEGVGHPLLGPSAVANPVNLGPWGQALVVTGSNMSGKSTYLRAIGVNLVLGRMGGPVDARAFRMPAVEIGTSMRVADSLADGVSFFMSELRRLKQIVDRSKAFAAGQDIQFVYLLDEILQGTNSQERQIAVTRVLQQLLARRAVGAISTHDLQLPDVQELAGQLQVVHFKESFVELDGKQTMTFDYVMRPGITPTTNALKLLALVGLDATE